MCRKIVWNQKLVTIEEKKEKYFCGKSLYFFFELFFFLYFKLECFVQLKFFIRLAVPIPQDFPCFTLAAFLFFFFFVFSETYISIITFSRGKFFANWFSRVLPSLTPFWHVWDFPFSFASTMIEINLMKLKLFLLFVWKST